MPFREVTANYVENHMEHMDTMCGQNVKFSMLKVSDAYSDQMS
jgi:hypothetical protein